MGKGAGTVIGEYFLFGIDHVGDHQIEMPIPIQVRQFAIKTDIHGKGLYGRSKSTIAVIQVHRAVGGEVEKYQIDEGVPIDITGGNRMGSFVSERLTAVDEVPGVETVIEVDSVRLPRSTHLSVCNDHIEVAVHIQICQCD